MEKKYYVHHQVVWNVTSSVMAGSKEEAIQKTKDGLDNIESKEYSYIHPDTEFIVEEV